MPVGGVQSSAPRMSLPGKSFECHLIFISPMLGVCCRLRASLAGYLCDLPHGVFYLFLSSVSQMCFSPYFAGLKKGRVSMNSYPVLTVGTNAPWPCLSKADTLLKHKSCVELAPLELN